MYTPQDFIWNEHFPRRGEETPDAIKHGNQRKFVALVFAGFVAQAAIVLCATLLAIRFAPAAGRAIAYLIHLVS
jgi:hypothetical protein